MLQTRNAKRPAQAAVRFAVDAVDEGLLTTAQALATIDADVARRAAAPDLRPEGRLRRCSRAGSPPRPAPPRARSCSPPQDAVAAAADGPRRDPRAAVHRGRGRRRLPRRQGDPHLRGRQGLARGAGRARAWAGPRSPARARSRSTCTPATVSGRRARSCTRATGSRSTAPPGRHRPTTCRWSRRRSTSTSRRCSSWADELRAARRPRQRRHPARTPAAPASFGAEGIGLCRTEHMFMAADRQPKMRAMIMADTTRPAPRRAGRAAAAAAGGLRGAVRGDGRAAGHDPPARPAAARVPARPLRAARADRARADRGEPASWPSSSSCSSGCASSRGDQPDARHPRRAGSGSSTPRSTRCRSARSCARRSRSGLATARRPSSRS